MAVSASRAMSAAAELLVSTAALIALTGNAHTVISIMLTVQIAL